MMKQHPMLFTGEMVRAVLDRRKRVMRLLTGHYEVGDLIWVRETTWECIDNNDTLHYVADGPAPTTDRRHYKKRPNIFMPRWACRLELRVTSVRLEPLQDITYGSADNDNGYSCTDALGQFSSHWNSLYGKRLVVGQPVDWDANPEVQVVEFEVVK